VKSATDLPEKERQVRKPMVMVGGGHPEKGLRKCHAVNGKNDQTDHGKKG